MGCPEILENGNPKSVAINEDVSLAKQDCDERSRKLFNGILDTLDTEEADA